MACRSAGCRADVLPRAEPGRARPGERWLPPPLRGGGGPDVGPQPRVDGRGEAEELYDSILRPSGSQPCPRGPLTPRDQALVAEQLDARMVPRIAARSGLKDVVACDLEPGRPGLGHHAR